ncbi:hypothetical protein [Streptomyces xantholiticus]|uniref:hypothetical protein n=1 Tax=Streptomyces xantholiticus TaxID=68285 RepID=UPI001672F5E1|nr:hypothetical protein [Streptomyces xantholiticus]
MPWVRQWAISHPLQVLPRIWSPFRLSRRSFRDGVPALRAPRGARESWNDDRQDWMLRRQRPLLSHERAHVMRPLHRNRRDRSERVCGPGLDGGSFPHQGVLRVHGRRDRLGSRVGL